MVRYERPIPDKIVVSSRFPSEVGWMKDLYRYPDADPSREQWLEQRVFQLIDSKAARVLSRMLQPTPVELNASELSHWAMLIRSLMHRTPENLRSTMTALARIDDQMSAQLRHHYDELRGEGDPPTYEEYEASLAPDERQRAALRLLPQLMLNARVGTFMINMRWRVFSIEEDCPQLLMSDDPVARTNGIANPNGHLAMPLSPSRLLVMAGSDSTMRSISSMRRRDLARNMNEWTVESARRFVVAVDRRQERFIRNRFGINVKPSLTANLGLLDQTIAEDDWLQRARQRRLLAATASPATATS